MEVQTKYGVAFLLLECPLIDSTESLEFLTEVHEAYNGSEIRASLRDTPRQTLEFNYTQQYKGVGDIFNMLYANLRKQWAIPLRHIYLEHNGVNDSDFIEIDTSKTMPDLNVGYALLNNEFVEIVSIGKDIVIQEEIKDPETNEIIQEEIIEHIDGFKLSKKVTIPSGRIAPVRICIIDGDASITTGGFWSNAKMVFRVIAEDLKEFTQPAPPQYKGSDLYFMPLLTDGGSLSMTLNQRQSIVDGVIGAFQDFSFWERPRYIKPLKTLSKSLDYFMQSKAFYYRRNGRLKPFWMPLYEKHINYTNTGVITSSIQVDNAYTVAANRKHIAVKRKNNEWTCHEIVSQTNGFMQVSPQINANIADIENIFYLGLHRLDSDIVKFEFLGGDVSQSTVSILELEP